MKALTVILLLIALGCGKKDPPTAPISTACASVPFVGTWHDSVSDDTLVLTSACTGTNKICGYSFNYSLPNDQNRVTVVITKSNHNKYCLTEGTTICEFDLNKNQLTLDCGTGIFVYEK